MFKYKVVRDSDQKVLFESFNSDVAWAYAIKGRYNNLHVVDPIQWVIIDAVVDFFGFVVDKITAIPSLTREFYGIIVNRGREIRERYFTR